MTSKSQRDAKEERDKDTSKIPSVVLRVVAGQPFIDLHEVPLTQLQ